MAVVDVDSLGNEPVDPDDDLPDEAKKIAGRSPTQIAMQRLRSDKLAIFNISVIVFLILIAVLAPLITTYWPWGELSTNGQFQLLDPLAGNLPAVGPPNHGFILAHPLGVTPNTGIDNTAFLLYGLRTDMFIGLVSTVLSMIIGIVLGLMAGFSRGPVDRIITFAIDVFLCFPFLIGAISLAPIIASHFASDQSALTKAQIFSLIGILVFFGWMGLARLIRGYVISLREREFIQAAQVIGAPTRRILFKELLPNLAGPIIVSLSLTLPALISAEAVLSFLGVGITGSPSIGQMIENATNYYASYPLYLYAPVFVLLVLVICLNLLGDSVRDAFDPGTRR
ncbi:MAG: peptide/nickel transport system permease protein [Nocardioidaceae bacterium]|jgi:ABC-type dipeptide/oligopeptide/nickel transport system permease subunit|nr:peptide/nickel transport system permease protein [Nocardioidaceae bacterium]